MSKYANKLDHPQYHILSEKGSEPHGLDLKVRSKKSAAGQEHYKKQILVFVHFKFRRF